MVEINAGDIEATHPLYDDFADQWQRMRDVISGEDAVKKAEDRYLPRLLEETDGEYRARKTRSLVYEAADRTLDALLGLLFRKPGVEVLPDSVKEHRGNIDLSGMPYEGCRHQIASEVLEVGRVGILVDWSRSERRPVWVKFDTENIRNWSETVMDGKRVVDQVILRETMTERAASGFGSEEHEQFRILELDEAGRYVSRVFRVNEEQSTEKRRVYTEDIDSERASDDRAPVIQGRPLTEIPFVCFGNLDLSLGPRKPPLLAVANVQLDHYRLGADLKHALHFGALPTLVVTGDDDDTRVYHLGSTMAIKLPMGADAKFVEYQGGSVEQIRAEMQADEQRMALLGARLLSAPKRQAETAEAMDIQREGEASSLSMIAQTLGLGLTRCWQHHVMWMGGDPKKVDIEINSDFVSRKMDPQMIEAQLKLVIDGTLSAESFAENLFEGEIAREPEVELARIQAQGPLTGPGRGEDLGGEDDQDNQDDAA